jgi:hypothetical protein
MHTVFLVGKPEMKPHLGRPRRRWVHNIRMGLRETVWEGVDWIRLAQDTDQWGGSCEHGNEASGSIKCGEIPEELSDC